jgi:hypothetical protein
MFARRGNVWESHASSRLWQTTCRPEPVWWNNPGAGVAAQGLLLRQLGKLGRRHPAGDPGAGCRSVEVRRRDRAVESAGSSQRAEMLTIESRAMGENQPSRGPQAGRTQGQPVRGPDVAYPVTRPASSKFGLGITGTGGRAAPRSQPPAPCWPLPN